jgi:hypothetical protein
MEEELDLDNRELCPDGSCTGVIGPDGRCKECGRARDGSAAVASLPIGQDGWRGTTSDDEAFDEDRQLCPDGSCTGLIGVDGKCKECGKSASAEASS